MARKQRTPLALSDDMLSALKKGQLSMTVRALNERDYSSWHDEDEDGWPIYEDDFGEWYRASPPYGPKGSYLWVRELYRVDEDGNPHYRFNEDCVNCTCSQSEACNPTIPASPSQRAEAKHSWLPLVGMPEAYSRYRLRVTRYEFRAGVRDLTDAEIRKCGFSGDDVREQFRKYWNKRYREHYQKWEQNPAIWITRFKLQTRKKRT